MSTSLLEDSGLDEQPCPALAGLPAQVKVLETEVDSVVSLEELTMRFLHRVQQPPAGESVRAEGFLQERSVSPPQRAVAAASRVNPAPIHQLAEACYSA